MGYEKLENKTMKNKKTILLIYLIFIICIKTYSQTFQYHLWSLNETVSFNDVENYLEDKTKIITKQFLYDKGEDIKFYDDFNTITTLVFYENTQVLKCVFINDIVDIAFINQLRQSIFNQLGQPIYGYEIKIINDVKNNTLMNDYVTYEMEYEYRIGNNIISLSFTSSGLKGNIPLFAFYTCIYELTEYNSSIPTKYPSLADKDYKLIILKYEMIRKW